MMLWGLPPALLSTVLEARLRPPLLLCFGGALLLCCLGLDACAKIFECGGKSFTEVTFGGVQESGR